MVNYRVDEFPDCKVEYLVLEFPRKFSFVVQENLPQKLDIDEPRFGIADQPMYDCFNLDDWNKLAKRRKSVIANGQRYRKTSDVVMSNNYRGFGKCREVKYELVEIKE